MKTRLQKLLKASAETGVQTGILGTFFRVEGTEKQERSFHQKDGRSLAMKSLTKSFIATFSLLVTALTGLTLFTPTTAHAAEKTDGSVGIQFRREEAESIANGSDYDSGNGLLGYESADGTRGGTIKASKWNIMAASNSGTDVTVTAADGSTTYTLTYSANGTWSHGDTTAPKTMIELLTRGYLDIANHGSGTGLSVTMTGLPTTGYDVALLLGGDTGANSLGVATVNDVEYGSAGWGNGHQTTTLEEGKNVLYVQGQTRETLTITAPRGISTRPTLAGLMIFPKEVQNRTATMSTDTAFSALTWDGGVAPTTGEIATVTIADGATLTIDQTLTIGTLKLVCAGDCTLLYSALDVLDGVGLDDSGVMGTVTSEYVIDASAGAITADDTLLTNVRTFGGVVTLKGTTENGVALNYGNNVGAPFGPRLVVESGKHTFKYGGGSGGNWATGDSNDQPSILVKDGTELDFYGKDLGGYSGTANLNAVVRVNDGGTLNLYKHGGTFYYRNRFYVEEGGEIKIPTNQELRLIGGTSEATAQLYVPAVASVDDKVAELNGEGWIFLPGDNTQGFAAFVGENATLKIAARMDTAGTTQPITKYGAGTLELTRENPMDGPVTVSAGTLKLVDNATIGSGAVTIASGATVEHAGTAAFGNTLSGAGTFKKTGSGELALSAAQLAGFGGTIEATAGTIALPLTNATTATLASGVTLKVLLTTEEQLVDQKLVKDGVTIYYYNEDGTTPLVTDDDGNPLPGDYIVPIKTWTITSSDPVNWSAATWTGGAPEAGDVACIDVGAHDVVVTMDAAATVKSLVITGTGTLTLVPTNDLTVTELISLTADVKLVYSVPEGTTAALPRMGGEGTFMKTGAGAVRFDTNLHSNDVVAEGITIELDAGAYYVGLNDSEAGGDPYMKDVTIKFLKTGATLGSFGWLHLEGTVTVDVPATVTGAGLSALPGKLVPSMQGAGATLVKTGDGQFDACLDNIGTTQIDAGLLGLRGEKTVPGVITGAGAVTVAGTAVVTLPVENTYTGGTVIPAGTTLKITNPNALGTGAITGEGVLEVSGAHSGNANIDPIVNKTGLTDSVGWQGTVRYTTTEHQARFDLHLVGNANSEIEFAGASGFFYTGGWSMTSPSTVRLTGEGLQLRNGSSGSGNSMKVHIPKLVGDGKLKGATGSPWSYTILAGDVTEFAGTIDISQDQSTQFGVILGTATLPSGFNHQDYWKKITIVEGGAVTLAAGQSFVTRTDGAVVVKGTLSGSGTVSGPLVFEPNATLIVDGTPLTAASTYAMNGALNVQIAKPMNELVGTNLLFFGENATLPTLTQAAFVVIDENGVTAPYLVEVNETARALQVVDTDYYTRAVTGAETWSATGAWVKGDETADTPPTDAALYVTAAEGAKLTVTDALTAGKLTVIGVVPMSLVIDLSAYDAYASIPRAGVSVPLVTTTDGLSGVTVSVAGLKYGATATITTTGAGATALITLPSNLYPEGQDTPDLDNVETFYAVLPAGETVWGEIDWGKGEGVVPGATDVVSLELAGDALLSCATADVPQAMALTVIGKGHALALDSLSAMAGIRSWTFDADTIFDLQKEGAALPETTAYPKRVRYTYHYTSDTGYTTTTNYETEFAAGYTAPSPVFNGGVLEFSNGIVTAPVFNPTGTQSTLIFSGNVRVTIAGNDGGLHLGTMEAIVRDTAAISTTRLRTADGNAGRTTRLTLEGKASLEVTGTTDTANNQASFLLSHWDGTTVLTLRGEAQLLALNVGAALAHSGGTSVFIEEDAIMKVRGVRINPFGSGTVPFTMTGGQLLLGSDGFRNASSRQMSIAFEGGSLGAWEDFTFDATAAAFCSQVTGTVNFENEDDAVLTFTALGGFAGAEGFKFNVGKVAIEDSAIATLPEMEVAAGATAEVGCTATTEKVTLAGGTLAFDGGVLTTEAYETTANSVVQIPLAASIREGGYLVMAQNGTVPDFSQTSFKMWLDQNRADTVRFQPLVPLCLGALPGGEPVILGFSSNSTNQAVTKMTAVYTAGLMGDGLYVALEGAEVLASYEVTLTADAPEYLLDQAVINVYPYYTFTSQVADARVVIPEGGVALPQGAFTGASTRLVAAGSEPHVLLQGLGYTLATDLTFDLTAWTTALEELARGAVKGVPASICLMSGGISAADGITLSAVHGMTLPTGFTESIEVTADGVYYVITAERRARTVSVNFTDSATPLAAPPSVIGAYALPLNGWNTLVGNFSSSDLKVSDLGGVAQVSAQNTAGSPTQVIAYNTQSDRDDTAAAALLKVWLSDSGEQTVRVVDVPFAAYRLAFIFATDVAGAGFAPVTVAGHTYAMDAEGYMRRDVTGYQSPATATGTPTVDVRGDSVWGDTAHTTTATPVVLGHNALVTDVLTSASAEITLPAFEYAKSYAGLAAIQIIEAPTLADVTTGTAAYSYTFDAAELDIDTTLALASPDGDPWVNGAGHTLWLRTTDPAQVVKLTLPEGFEADQINILGEGTLILRVENGGISVNKIDASSAANVTIDLPCVGVEFAPAQKTSRFEQVFDNNGQAYTIASGRTLSLGEKSGIVTSLDADAASLTIAGASEGVLRRDYPVNHTDAIPQTYKTLTLAGKSMTLDRTSGAYLTFATDLLVEDGDVVDASADGLWLNVNKSQKTYHFTQTGGLFEVATKQGADRGLLVGADGGVPVVLEYALTGGQFTAAQLVSWEANGSLTLNVSDAGRFTLLSTFDTTRKNFYTNVASAVLAVNFTNNGTWDVVAQKVEKAGAGTTTITIDGGQITTQEPTVELAVPMVFAGTVKIAPEAYSTIVLSEANTGTGSLNVTSGTLALANANAIGEATVNVGSTGTLEVRGVEQAAGVVHFDIGAELVVELTDVPADGVVKIAPALDYDDALTSMTAYLNGERYTLAASALDKTAGTVTFSDAAKDPVSGSVVWEAGTATGTWADGAVTPSPWQGGATYKNGMDVSFAGGTTAATVTVSGRVAPKSVAFRETLDTAATFVQDGEAFLDMTDALAAQTANALGKKELDLGADQIFDVPIETGTPATDLAAKPATLRLVGALSNGRKTASLVNSASRLDEDPTYKHHGIWHSAESYGLILAPHAGEEQILSPHGDHLKGSGLIEIRGGGTVHFTNWLGGDSHNFHFKGNFLITDGATLDFDTSRNQGDDNKPFFRTTTDGTVVPIWTATPGFTLQNGATLRFGNNTRSIIAGYAQRGDEAFIKSQPIVIGKDATVKFEYTRNDPQIIAHGLTLNGDNAKIFIGESSSQWRDLYLTRGVTIKVAGSGDKGDTSDPTKLDMDQTLPSGEANPNYTCFRDGEGITATIEAASDNVGLTCRAPDASTLEGELTFDVGANSTLRILADFTLPSSATVEVPYVKAGLGRLMLEHPEITEGIKLRVDAGTLGGSSELTSLTSLVTIAKDATLEAGLLTSSLKLESGATLAIDPSGRSLIRTQLTQFTANGTYTLASLQKEAEILDAAGRMPVKVMSWMDAQDVGTARFVLDEALTKKGYGISIRDDGLYLMASVVYVRELSFDVTGDPITYPWYAEGAWYREADTTQTKIDYAATEDEAAVARFVLPEAYAAEGAPTPLVTLTLDKAAHFANVVFGTDVPVDPTDPNSKKVFTPIAASVTYQYLLKGEDMPANNEAKEFTWVPTLIVDGTTTDARLSADVDPGYYTVTRDTTVIVYHEASAPAININFTDGAEGSITWIDSSSEPCGVVPFAGAYWNNASTTGAVPVMQDAHYTAYHTAANVVGVPNDEYGNKPVANVTYLVHETNTVASRRGSGNAALSSSYFKGWYDGTPDANVFMQDGTFTTTGSAHGWQVKVDAVPFTAYDLYLIFAGESSADVTYPAVRVKVGTEDWRTYSMVNGWTAPAATSMPWTGTGDLVNGGYALGKNLLHLRIAAPTGTSLEIAPSDAAVGANAARIGLAALQIVQCDDARYERTGAGDWSDAMGWKTSSATGAWQDATTSAPHFAYLSNISSLNANLSAATPWVRAAGNVMMTLSGADRALNTGAIDLRDLGETSEVNFTNDFFEQTPNIILAPGVTFTVPETDETTTNNWLWLYDDDTSTSAETSTLKKTSANDLIIGRKILSKLNIKNGTLWISTETDGSYTREQDITGDGIFGKTGANTLTLSGGAFDLTSATPIVVEGGELIVNSTHGFGELEAGCTALVDGATLALGVGKGYAPDMQIHAINGGTYRTRGALNVENARATILLEGGSTYNRTSGNNDGAHSSYAIKRLIARGVGNSVWMNPGRDGDWDNRALTILDGILVEANASLTIEGPDGGIRLPDAPTIEVQAGATLTTKRKVGIGSHANGANGYNSYTPSAEKPLVKKGEGIWRVEEIFSCKIDDSYGEALTIEAGEVHFARGGNTHTVNGTTTLPITILSGAKLAGNVTFTQNSPVVVKAGGTLLSGMPGVADSEITVHTLTFEDGAILEVDLDNTSALAVPAAVTGENPVPAGTVTLQGDLIVRLTNLPTVLSTTPRKLTNFAVAPSRSGTIICAEAAALNGEVVFGDGSTTMPDANNLYLVPTNDAYLWEGKTGNWSASTDGTTATPPAWTLQGVEVPFPTTGLEIVARISGTSDLTVDKKPLASTDGAAWQTQMLIFAPEATDNVTLLQGATLPTDVTTITSYLLNRPAVSNTLWKLGEGDVTTYAPIVMGAADTRANFVGGTFTMAHPFITSALDVGTEDYAVVPTTMEFSNGATLRFALAADAETVETAKYVLTSGGKTYGYDPLKQTLAGNITGSGTIALTAGITADATLNAVPAQLILTGNTDNDINYDVQQGTLTLAGNLPVLARQSERTIRLAKATTLELKTEGAAGYTSALTWTLAAADADTSVTPAVETGAKVTTENNARIRGTVNVVPETGATAPTAILGTSLGSIDGDLTLAVPAGATLKFGGSWLTPADTLSGQIVKTGTGKLEVSGAFQANLPVDLREGRIIFLSGSSLNIADNNDTATRADWTLARGTALRFENTGKADFGVGTLTVASGAVLDIASSTLEIGAGINDLTGIRLENASMLRMGANDTVSTLRFLRPTEIVGTVDVNLDAIADALIADTSTTEYDLIVFPNGLATRRGSGIFQLGGDRMVDLAKAGWALSDEGVTVVLRRLASGMTYTWSGNDANDWTSTTPSWYPPNVTDPDQKKAWADIVLDPTAQPAVLFQDTDAGTNDPIASGNVNWSAGTQTLGALRCDNATLPYTFTANKAADLAADAFDADLIIAGDLLKTGNAKLTIDRPLVLARNTGLLKVLEGELELLGELKATSGNFDRPITVTDGATLRFGGAQTRSLLGRIEGDGEGIIAHSGTATLTLGAALDNLAELQVESGAVRLTAQDHTTVKPEITVADNAQLVYAGTFSTLSDIAMRVNAGATPTGTLIWEGTTSVNTTRVPNFVAPAGTTDAALNVATFRYSPQAGHLAINPGTAIFPATTKLELNADPTAESLSLLLGAETTNGTTLTFAGLGGSGGLIGAEPVIDTLANAWSTRRVLTLRLAEDNTFSGAFMGAKIDENVQITTGLTLEKDPAATANPTFTYTGASTNADLGTLTVGNETRAEVTGTWAGDVTVAAGGELTGSGILGETGRTINVPAGAKISASAMGKRLDATGAYTTERIPTDLTVRGTLSLDTQSEMTVLIRKTLENEAPWVSCINTETLLLPDNAGTVMLNVILDREDPTYVVSNIPILTWANRTGALSIDGNVYYKEADGTLTPTTDYYLSQEEGMLKLKRTSARFWMILR